MLFEDFSLFEVKPQTAQLVGENLYAEEFQNSNFVVEFEVFDKESQIRTFTHLRKPKEKAKQETVSIDILFDADKKQGKFILKNSEFLNRLMIFSNLEGLKIHKNLLDLIPGTYEIPFSSITCPKLSDIELKWL